MPRTGTLLPTNGCSRTTPPPATIRSSLVRTCLITLAVATAGADLGCSHLRSRPQKSGAGPATLGAEMPGPDIYAARTPTGATFARPAAAGSATAPTALALGGDGAASSPVLASAPAPSSAPRSGQKAPTVASPTSTLAVVGNSEPRPTTRLVDEARATLDAMTSYQLALKRQERVNGALLPPEDLIMSIRRNPKAARLTWADGPHRGREVIYRADEPGGQMHVNMADSKFPMPRLSLAPDSPMVMKNSRHPITEAGLDPIVASLEQADRAGTLVDLGMQTPPPLDHPHHALMRTTPEGDVWRAYIDPASRLPMLVECQGRNGELLEQYLFRDIQANPPELASNGAFDPDARWGAPRGLFGRMAAKTDDPAPDSASR